MIFLFSKVLELFIAFKSTLKLIYMKQQNMPRILNTKAIIQRVTIFFATVDKFWEQLKNRMQLLKNSLTSSILVPVFLDGYLRVMGRKSVSRGSKWYEYCHALSRAIFRHLCRSFFFESFGAMATFCVKWKKCDNFGLCWLLCSWFFWLNFWFYTSQDIW